MKDEHSNSMSGGEEPMANGTQPSSVSAPAPQSPAHTTRASLPAQDTRSRFTAQNVRGRRAAVSGEVEPRSTGFSTAPSVELHIEELVLHGFAPGDRYRIGDACERELARLFTEQGVPPSISRGVELDRLNAGAFQVKPGSNPQTTGVRLAQAIYRGFGK